LCAAVRQRRDQPAFPRSVLAGTGHEASTETGRPGPPRPPGCRLTLRRGSSGPPRLGNLTPVRLTVFWERMRAQFGEAYAGSVAQDHVLSGLGGRTVNQALA